MRIEPGYLEIVSEVLRDLGHDPAAFGVETHGRLSEPEFLSMTEFLVAETKEPTLALRIGTKMHIGTHGLLGHAILSSRNLRQAAELLAQYNPIAGARGNIRLSFGGDKAILTFVPPFEVKGAPCFMTDLFFGGLTTGLRQVVGGTLFECSVEIAGHPTMPEMTYETYLGVPVSFGHSANRFVGPLREVDEPLPAASIPLSNLYRRQCEALLRDMAHAEGLAAEIRKELLSARGHFPDMEELANTHNMSERTLRRRLAEEETSYRDLLDEVRSHLAREYLRDTPLTVVDIASLLGFEDVANFRRAFRRWTGLAPQKYRETASSTV
ncbi:AraC family transcriptional regulator ligand-binding domain-containing protein [Parvibaculum sp. MBR-TMA-1.3b-4.2]|jgi:AraC-like DNA-binding protein